MRQTQRQRCHLITVMHTSILCCGLTHWSIGTSITEQTIAAQTKHVASMCTRCAWEEDGFCKCRVCLWCLCAPEAHRECLCVMYESESDSVSCGNEWTFVHSVSLWCIRWATKVARKINVCVFFSFIQDVHRSLANCDLYMYVHTHVCKGKNLLTFLL